MTYKWFLAGMMALALGQSCSKNKEEDILIVCPEPGNQFSLKISEKILIYTNGQDSVPFSFKSVKEDSRCPRGMQCVWAGTVHIIATINGAQEIELELNKPQEISHVKDKKWIITLIDLLPYPGTVSSEGSPAYVARFKLDVLP